MASVSSTTQWAALFVNAVLLYCIGRYTSGKLVDSLRAPEVREIPSILLELVRKLWDALLLSCLSDYDKIAVLASIAEYGRKAFDTVQIRLGAEFGLGLRSTPLAYLSGLCWWVLDTIVIPLVNFGRKMFEMLR